MSRDIGYVKLSAQDNSQPLHQAKSTPTISPPAKPPSDRKIPSTRQHIPGESRVNVTGKVPGELPQEVMHHKPWYDACPLNKAL